MAVGAKLGFWDFRFLKLGFWDLLILKLGFWDPYPPYAPLRKHSSSAVLQDGNNVAIDSGLLSATAMLSSPKHLVILARARPRCIAVGATLPL